VVREIVAEADRIDREKDESYGDAGRDELPERPFVARFDEETVERHRAAGAASLVR